MILIVCRHTAEGQTPHVLQPEDEQVEQEPLHPGFAKADMSFSAPFSPQAGQVTSSSLLLEKLITSNSCLHFLHAYS
jgi:hypothetical protein